MKALHILLSLSLFAICSCARQPSGATKGGLGGAAIGAGLGAIIGNQTGDAGAGTAIGAGIGALAGAAIGNEMDKTDMQASARDEELARQREIIAENRRLIDELRAQGQDVRSTDRGVVINLPDVLFEFDSSELTPGARGTVRDIARVLSDVKGRGISVEGHTDSIGTFSYNEKLSNDRANSVRDSLISSGIPAGQVRAVGYGEGSPISSNNTEAGRARNRRVEVIVEN